MSTRFGRGAGLWCLVLLAACQTGINFSDPSGPRFAGPAPVAAPSAQRADTLLIVSFNIENAEHIDSALAVLQSEPDLEDADIVLLQEMNAAATRRIAEALGMAWVYYPAILREATDRQFGNAVLSRWPITSDEKLVLPHLAIFGRTQRIATVASVQVGSTSVRVYSVHLATPVNMSLRDRRDQMRTVLDDAASHPFVVMGGDLNSGSMDDLVQSRAYDWATLEGPRTVTFGRWDHIVLRGFLPRGDNSTGTIADNKGSSDHNPVWVKAVLNRDWGR